MFDVGIHRDNSIKNTGKSIGVELDQYRFHDLIFTQDELRPGVRGTHYWERCLNRDRAKNNLVRNLPGRE